MLGVMGPARVDTHDSIDFWDQQPKYSVLTVTLAGRILS